MTNDPKRQGLRQRAKEELLEYVAISLYVCVFLGALLNYRRVVLAQVGISYAHYGYAFVEALILAKLILIGEAMHIGKSFERLPLAISAAYKSLVFGVFVLIFQVAELAVHNLVKGESMIPELTGLLMRPSATLAHVLVVIMAFVPFFLLREAGRQLGEERLFGLLFRRPPK